MSKILVIGAAGLIGEEVVKALGESECIRASRNSGEHVDISDPKSLTALFERVGELDGIVCTGGARRAGRSRCRGAGRADRAGDRLNRGSRLQHRRERAFPGRRDDDAGLFQGLGNGGARRIP